MAKATSPTPDINLIPGDELENRPQGKFLKWALTWGKRIVVGTELIVILAFLSRFWLDTTVADLNDKIAQKKAVVVASQEFEKKFRAIAQKVEKSIIIDKSLSSLTVYDKTRSLIPPGVNLNLINVNEKKVSFSGSSDETTLALLVAAFKDSPDFSDVSVERISKKSLTTTVEFAFSANYGSPK